MKTAFFKYLSIGVLGVSTISATEVILLTDLTETMLEEFAAGQYPTAIVEFKEGMSLPLKLIIKGEFLALDPEQHAPLSIKVLKICFVRCDDEGNFFFSTNLQNWSEFTEFFTGEIGVALAIENGKVSTNVEVDLQSRGKDSMMIFND